MLILHDSSALTSLSNSHFNHSVPACWPPCCPPSPQAHFYFRDSSSLLCSPYLQNYPPSSFRILPKSYLSHETYPLLHHSTNTSNTPTLLCFLFHILLLVYHIIIHLLLTFIFLSFLYPARNWALRGQKPWLFYLISQMLRIVSTT